MIKKSHFLFLIVLALLSSCKDEYNNLPDGLYAIIDTNKGTIIAELEYIKTPVTVANFVTLAEGKNPFVSAEFKNKPFFDGLRFHRVIADFMIQTGDPLGNGSGDAGYKFKDEITDLKHDTGGILSMANSGPNTNSSQFFITHLPTPWLDGRHTVFGHIVENGMEVVNQIQQDDVINSVTILKKGEAAKKFHAAKVFGDYFKSESEIEKKQAEINAEKQRIYNEKYKVIKDQKVTYFDEVKSKATKTTSGLKYKIIQDGKGKKPQKGTTVFVHYAGFLEDGTLFDTSIASVAKTFGTFDENRALQRGYSPLPFEAGTKDGMIPGFIEGLEKMKIGDKAILFITSNLAYGEQGAGGVIPPNANIIFEVELMEK